MASWALRDANDAQLAVTSQHLKKLLIFYFHYLRATSFFRSPPPGSGSASPNVPIWQPPPPHPVYSLRSHKNLKPCLSAGLRDIYLCVCHETEKSKDDIKRCITLACTAIPGQGGGERESGVAKQGIRLGHGGDKRADYADKQDRQTRTSIGHHRARWTRRDQQTWTRTTQGLRRGQARRTDPDKARTRPLNCLGNKRRTQGSPAWPEHKKRTTGGQHPHTGFKGRARPKTVASVVFRGRDTLTVWGNVNLRTRATICVCLYDIYICVCVYTYIYITLSSLNWLP